MVFYGAELEPASSVDVHHEEAVTDCHLLVFTPPGVCSSSARFAPLCAHFIFINSLLPLEHCRHGEALPQHHSRGRLPPLHSPLRGPSIPHINPSSSISSSAPHPPKSQLVIRRIAVRQLLASPLGVGDAASIGLLLASPALLCLVHHTTFFSSISSHHVLPSTSIHPSSLSMAAVSAVGCCWLLPAAHSFIYSLVN